MSTTLQRLLLIKLGSLSDAVLLVPALRALRRALPDTDIHWLVSSYIAPLARMVPYVDQVLDVPDVRPANFFRAMMAIRSRKFDAVVDFDHGSRATAFLTLLSKAPVRLGFFSPNRTRPNAFTERHWKYFSRHDAHEFISLVGMLTPVVFDPTLELWESEEGRNEVKNLELKKSSGSPLVVIHPGCGATGRPREWPLPNFAVTGQWLMQKYGAKLVLTGGRDDARKTADLRRLMNNRAVDLGGRLSIPGLISVLNQADLVISGNTGPMHMAAALGRPQIALHGPSDVLLRGPLNPKARILTSDCPECPCLRFGHEYHRFDQSCMASISVEDVKTAVAAAFDNMEAI